MSEKPSSEKTEQATPKKERDARDKGQVARSQEVVTTVSLISVVAYIWFSWNTIVNQLTYLFDHVASLHGQDFQSSAHRALWFTANESIRILLPLLGITIFFGIAANYLQFGSIFAFETIKPKAENVNPLKGLKKILSVKQITEQLKTVIKIALLSTLLFYVIRDAISPYVRTVYCGLSCLTQVTHAVFSVALFYAALAFILVAGLDFIFQQRQHDKSLMMTKDEVKREFKESEGDPIVKKERKQIAREMVMDDGVERTKKATAVIINPTHFAVVIDYKPEIRPLPILVAKGQNLYAHELRTQAELAGVPIFRNVPLARSLFADTEIDSFVPDEWFGVIAEILAWVNQNRHTLYGAPLQHGVIDMEDGDHRSRDARQTDQAGW